MAESSEGEVRSRTKAMIPSEKYSLKSASELKPYLVHNVKPTGEDLGRGAYGCVIELELPGVMCAGKQIHENLISLANPQEVRRITKKFVAECRLMSSLRHPNIVQFLGICFLPSSRIPILLMEKLHTSLESLVRRTPNIPLSMKRSMLHDVARGLLYLHTQVPPIVHRDLTAGNVLLTTDMVAKITDLGVARILNVDHGKLPRLLTQVPGTAVYMPPEAFELNPRYDLSLDVFSFGNLAMYTLTQERLDVKGPMYYVRGELHALTEIERRSTQLQQLKNELGEDFILTRLTVQCLKNNPQERPLTKTIVLQLEEAKEEIPDRHGHHTRLDLLQALAECEMENEKLKQQIRMLQRNSTPSIGFQFDADDLEDDDAFQDDKADDGASNVPSTSIPLRFRMKPYSKTLSADSAPNLRHFDNSVATSKSTTLYQLPNTSEERTSLDDTQQALVRSLPVSYRLSRMHHAQIPATRGSRSRSSSPAPLLEKGFKFWQKSQSSSTDGTPPMMPYLSAEPPHLSLLMGQQMPFAMSDAQAVLIDDKLYIGGGFTDGEEEGYIVLFYNTDMKEWFKLPRCPVCHFAMTAIKGKLVLVGGEAFETNSISDLVLVWDSSYDQWFVPYPPMPTARTEPAAVGYYHFIIVIGGRSHTGARLETIEILDTLNSRWFTAADPLPLKCSRPVTVQIGDMLYILGGGVMHSISTLHLIFHATSATTPSTPVQKRLPSDPLEFSAVVFLPGTDQLLAVGGKDDGRISSAMNYYCPTSKTWEKVGQLPAPRSCATCVALASGRTFVVIGGYTDAGTRTHMLHVMSSNA